MTAQPDHLDDHAAPEPDAARDRADPSPAALPGNPSGAGSCKVGGVEVSAADVVRLRAHADRVRELRTEAGLSAGQLSALAGRGTNYVGSLERLGFRPRLAAVRDIADALGLVLERDPAEVFAELEQIVGPAVAPPGEARTWPGKRTRPRRRLPAPLRPPLAPEGDPIQLHELMFAAALAEVLAGLDAEERSQLPESAPLRAAILAYIAARPPSLPMLARRFGRLGSLHPLTEGDQP